MWGRPALGCPPERSSAKPARGETSTEQKPIVGEASSGEKPLGGAALQRRDKIH